MTIRPEKGVGVLLLSFLLGASALIPQALAQSNPNTQLMYELLNRIERLEQEVRQLRGEMELYRYHQQEQERRFQDLEQRLQALDGRGAGAAPSQYPPPESTYGPLTEPATPPVLTAPTEQATPPAITAPPPLPAAQTPAGSEQTVYESALGLLREGRYDQAIAAFRDFIAAHPNSPLTGDAHYWLGEAYYINRNYDMAKQALLTVGSQYPRSEKLPDTLLRLGYVYQELGEQAKARDVWQKLVEVYPNTQAAAVAQKRLQSLR